MPCWQEFQSAAQLQRSITTPIHFHRGFKDLRIVLPQFALNIGLLLPQSIFIAARCPTVFALIRLTHSNQASSAVYAVFICLLYSRHASRHPVAILTERHCFAQVLLCLTLTRFLFPRFIR
jgi:hypothetical protein